MARLVYDLVWRMPAPFYVHTLTISISWANKYIHVTQSHSLALMIADDDFFLHAAESSCWK